jgi:epoxyqueuosine reductase QueG
VKKEIILNELFKTYNTKLNNVIILAQKTKALIDKIDPFIQNYTSIVCPQCKDVCCINRHSRYDFDDLLYIHALQVEELVFLQGIDDNAPCQFLSSKGCTIERFRRPFRCNWYFCDSLLKAMINGPARPYRSFINLMNEIVQSRKGMIDKFFAVWGNRRNIF